LVDCSVLQLPPYSSSRNWKQHFGLSLDALAGLPRSGCRVFPGRWRARRLRRLGVLNRGISRAKMPRVRTLLCEPGLGLKLSRPVQCAFISQALSLDQIFGGLPLKEASGFKADNACVRMSSDVLDHGTPCGRWNQFVRDFEARVGEFMGGQSAQLSRRFAAEHLADWPAFAGPPCSSFLESEAASCPAH